MMKEAVFSRIHRGESVCIQSQTGTGKTLAMLLPLLTAMSEESTWGFDGDKVPACQPPESRSGLFFHPQRPSLLIFCPEVGEIAR